MLLRTLKSLFSQQNTEQIKSIPERVQSLIREKQYDGARKLLNVATHKDIPDAMKWALLGEVEFHLNQPELAESLFYRALRLQPGLAEGHYGLSLLYYEAQRFEDSLAQAQYARNQAPGKARILSQLGLCHIAMHEFGPAREVLRQAVLLDPENVPAINNFAIALHAMGEYSDAWYYFKRALTINPEYAPAKENVERLLGVGGFETNFDPATGTLGSGFRGTDLSGRTEYDDILLGDIQELENKFDLFPGDPVIALRLVRSYLKNLQLNDANDILYTALAHNPEYHDLMLMKALIAGQLNHKQNAKRVYRLILQSDPNNVDALLGLSKVLTQIGLVEDALAPVERAVALRETPQALLQLAFTQCTACRYEECLATCSRVEAMVPDLGPYLNASRAVSHAYLGQFDKAMDYIAQSQKNEMANTEYLAFQGMLHLMHGNYEEGWRGYHYRYYLNNTMKRLLPYRVWQGEDLSDKTILVLAEQGLGDQVMFASCLPDLLERSPTRVLLEANNRVEKTLARSFPSVQVISSMQQSSYEWLDPDIEPDYYVPLADLPRFFRNNIEAFPDHRGYLIADPGRVAYWRERVRPEGKKPLVGITWRGGTQLTRQSIRTLKLEQLEPLIAIEGISYVCLQYGEVASELADFMKSRDLSIQYFPEAIQDLDEFAALICALDLVITVCNTTVHYAGALGKDCWVMAPYIPEWRYGLKSQNMCWYPSVRIFRQQSNGGWQYVLDQTVTAMQEWITSRA